MGFLSILGKTGEIGTLGENHAFSQIFLLPLYVKDAMARAVSFLWEFAGGRQASVFSAEVADILSGEADKTNRFSTYSEKCKILLFLQSAGIVFRKLMC